MNPVRVFIIDEHKPSRNLARRIFKSSPDIDLVGEATSPFTVRKAVNDSSPDVLAINPQSRISRQLGNLSKALNMPVVEIPQPGLDYNWHSIELHKVQYAKYASGLVSEIKAAGNASGGLDNKAKLGAESLKKQSFTEDNTCKMSSFEQAATVDTSRLKRPGERIQPGITVDYPLVVIGAPGGDLDALKVLLSGLQSQSTAILIAQQIPVSFDSQYMESLTEISMLPVIEAVEGQPIQPGKILVAPSDRHIEIVKKNGRYCCHFSQHEFLEESSSGRKPSLDLLFESLAENAGSMGIGILLLGVGSEGAKGLSRLKQVGANILVQENDLHKNSSMPGTMPSAAIMNGGAELIVPLNNIASKVTQIIAESYAQAN